MFDWRSIIIPITASITAKSATRSRLSLLDGCTAAWAWVHLSVLSVLSAQAMGYALGLDDLVARDIALPDIDGKESTNRSYVDAYFK